LKVVMIEDDPDLCEGWKDIFDLLGHELTCYPRARQALADQDVLNGCELVISDYYLPDLNGVELLRQVRAINSSVPVILLTGSREIGIVEAVKRIQGCTLLYKPVNINVLEKHLATLRSA
jgi:DNA-binding response OmpR family regulator